MNVVPLKNPSAVRFQSDVNIPFTPNSNKCSESRLSKNCNSGDCLVCYGLQQPSEAPEVGNKYTIAKDPRDSVFYSTCFVRESVTRIEGDTETPINSGPLEWQFGDKCIDCDTAKDAQKNIDDDTARQWSLADNCEKCN